MQLQVSYTSQEKQAVFSGNHLQEILICKGCSTDVIKGSHGQTPSHTGNTSRSSLQTTGIQTLPSSYANYAIRPRCHRKQIIHNVKTKIDAEDAEKHTNHSRGLVRQCQTTRKFCGNCLAELWSSVILSLPE